jgi:tetratricopeptide (TPR) repeat protein
MKKIFASITLALLMLGPVMIAGGADSSLDTKSIEIYQDFKNGVLPSTITKYEGLVNDSPNDASLHYLLGIAYLYADSTNPDATFDKGLGEFMKAKELDSKLKYVNSSIGYIYWTRGNYDKAIESYKMEIAIDPGSAATYLNLGMAYEGLKQWDKAKSQYIIAIDKDPKIARVYNNLGRIYMEWDGDYFKALDNFKKAVDLKPTVNLYKENYNLAVRKLKALRESVDKGTTTLPPETVERLRKMELKEIVIGTEGT